MQQFIEKLKTSIMSESYEDRAGRSVISVKSALEAIDRLAAEQPDPLADIVEELEDLKLYGSDIDTVQTCIGIVLQRMAAEQPERKGNTGGISVRMR